MQWYCPRKASEESCSIALKHAVFTAVEEGVLQLNSCMCPNELLLSCQLCPPHTWTAGHSHRQLLHSSSAALKLCLYGCRCHIIARLLGTCCLQDEDDFSGMQQVKAADSTGVSSFEDCTLMGLVTAAHLPYFFEAQGICLILRPYCLPQSKLLHHILPTPREVVKNIAVKLFAVTIRAMMQCHSSLVCMCNLVGSASDLCVCAVFKSCCMYVQFHEEL